MRNPMIMKYIYSRWSLVIYFMIFSLVACVDDLQTSGSHDIVEGIRVVVPLGFGVTERTEITRASASDEVERTVNRLFVIAFHSDGSLSSFKSAAQDAEKGGILYTMSNTTGSGSVKDFPMETGAGQQIFMVANPTSGVGTLTSEQLQSFSGTLDDFLALTSSLTSNNRCQVERMAFLMSGQLNNSEGGTDINVELNSSDSNQGEFTNVSSGTKVMLNRVDARITFKITVDASNNAGMTFTPRYYRVEKIPQGTYLIPKTDAEGNGIDYYDAGYVSMSEENITKNFDEIDVDGTSVFDFYILENRLSPKIRIETKEDTDAESLYALREKRDDSDTNVDGSKPGQEYNPGSFVYANDNSTYVEIFGTLRYTDNNKNDVVAEVSYTIHLGSTGTASDADDPNKVNDYNTKRNTHYTYNVTLTGIESMRVEVSEDKETRPGMEGSVTISPARLERDSHFGRALFSLTRSALINGLSWQINTPFQSGSKQFDKLNFTNGNGDIVTSADGLTSEQKAALQTTQSLNDYRWVQFVINSEAIKLNGSSVADDEYAKYPGQDAYDGGAENTPPPAFGGTGYHVNDAYYSKDVVLYDVNQLLNHLYIEANNTDSQIFRKNGVVSSDGDAIVTITAFIDEYIYVYDPTTVFYKKSEAVQPGDEGLLLWKKVVNGSNRELSIYDATGAQYSPDGNTSWSEASITFSQHPIYTFYNTSAVSTAWGTESDNETGRLVTTTSVGTLPSSNSTQNGRENTLDILDNGTLHWNDFMNTDADGYGSLVGNYSNIWYACLARNRDLNGDNVVSGDEVRWYLASIDQLTDLWIGEAAVPQAKLYDTDVHVSDNIEPWHIASSSLNSNTRNDENVWIIWGEEGASRGARSSSTGTNGNYYDYRCVRNLGLSLNEIDKVAENYYELSKGSNRVGYTTYNEYIVDLSKLNNNVLRAGAEGIVLESHDERSDINRPSRKMAVLVDNIYPTTGTWTWNNIFNNESQGTPCPDGYRIPNQRELLLLMMYFGFDRPDTNYNNLFAGFNSNSNSFYGSKTKYGFNGLYGITGRYGFQVDVAADKTYATFALSNNGTGSEKVRCVRDIVD